MDIGCRSGSLFRLTNSTQRRSTAPHIAGLTQFVCILCSIRWRRDTGRPITGRAERFHSDRLCSGRWAAGSDNVVRRFCDAWRVRRSSTTGNLSSYENCDFRSATISLCWHKI